MPRVHQNPIILAGGIVVLLSLVVGGLLMWEHRLQPADHPATKDSSKEVIVAPSTSSAPLLPESAPLSTPSRSRANEGSDIGSPPLPPLPIATHEQKKEMLTKAIEALKLSYSALYADFFSDEQLDPKQAEHLLSLLITEQQQTMERMLTFDPSTGDQLPSPQEIQDQQGEVEQTIKKLYGTDIANRLQFYRKTIPDRSIVLEAQEELSTPLSKAEVSKVTQIIYEERQAAFQKASTNPTQFPQELEAIGKRVRNRIQPLLSSEQADTISRVLEQLTAPMPPAPPPFED